MIQLEDFVTYRMSCTNHKMHQSCKQGNSCTQNNLNWQKVAGTVLSKATKQKKVAIKFLSLFSQLLYLPLSNYMHVLWMVINFHVSICANKYHVISDKTSVDNKGNCGIYAIFAWDSSKQPLKTSKFLKYTENRTATYILLRTSHYQSSIAWSQTIILSMKDLRNTLCNTRKYCCPNTLNSNCLPNRNA